MVGNQDQAAAAEPPPAEDEPAIPPPLREFDEARRLAAESPGRGAFPGPTTVVGRGPSWIAMGWGWIAIGWGALAVFVGLAVGGALIGRDFLIAKVPETERLYAMVGLTPEAVIGDGLDIRDVTQVFRLVDGANTLMIEGAVVNVTEEPRKVPTLEAVITNTAGQPLLDWTFSAQGTDLAPGAIARFQTSTRNPPSEGDLNLRFVEPR